MSIIWGPTCDSLDILEQNVMMPRLEVGQWLFYENMGAYTQVAASNFNGFPKTKAYYFMDEQTW